LDKAE